MTLTQLPAHSQSNIGTVLLTAGTGKTGRRIASRLALRDDVTVNVGSRSLAGAGTTVFDWNVRSTGEHWSTPDMSDASMNSPVPGRSLSPKR